MQLFFRRNQPWQPSWNQICRNYTISRRTFLLSLVTWHAIVLKNKSNILQPTRGHEGYYGFRKVTTLALGNISSNAGDLACSKYNIEKKSKMSQPIRGHCGHLKFRFAPKSNNTSSEPLYEHFR
jgi:hypothetical protein